MRASRIRVIEIIVALSVVVISLASVVVAVQQSRVMRTTLEASIMPVVEYAHGNLTEDGEFALRFYFENNGLGLGEVHDLALYWNDAEITNIVDFLAECCAHDDLDAAAAQAHVRGVLARGEFETVSSAVQGRVLTQGRSIDLFSVPLPEADTQSDGRAIWRRLDAERSNIRAEFCYCSLLDDCWRVGGDAERRETADCPAQ